MSSFITIHGLQIEYRLIEHEDQSANTKSPTLVFLHEGLGSMKMWKQFPDDICKDNKLRGLVFSRPGYGWSDSDNTPLDKSFMHHQAKNILPTLLTILDIKIPLLIGHSDGASIALIAASQKQQRLVGVVAIAPHVIVEEKTVSSIKQFKANYYSKNIWEKLARYHKDPHSMFSNWEKIWLDPSFGKWSVVDLLSKIETPLLLIQGEDDEYGTTRQLDIIKDNIKTYVHTSILPKCGHSPQFDQPDLTRKLIKNFINGEISKL